MRGCIHPIDQIEPIAVILVGIGERVVWKCKVCLGTTDGWLSLWKPQEVLDETH